jgi:hypothetical protein
LDLVGVDGGLHSGDGVVWAATADQLIRVLGREGRAG